MGYVIAAILVVLIVGGAVFFAVNRATRKSNVSDSETPVGDTNQHTEELAGGGGRRRAGPDDPGVARPVVGGEAEGEREV